MSDIAAMSSLIALSTIATGCVIAWVWIGLDEFRRRRREGRERGERLARMLKLN